MENQNCTRDEISSATLITELIPVHKNEKLPILFSSSWCSAFSPNESYFAWSSGNCIVTLIPMSFCKQSLFKSQKITVPYKSELETHKHSEHETDDCFGCNTISISTGHIVRSMAFGLSTLNLEKQSSPPFWSRFSSSKDLILATGHFNGRIRTWDVLTGKLILELIDHTDMVSDLTFSPIGNLVLMSASFDGSLKVWDLHEDGNMFQTLKMNNKPIYSCSWSPDAKSLVSVGMCQMIFVWDMTTYSVKFKLCGHQHNIVACAFSPDGCLIVSASWDTRVILWNSINGTMLKSFGHLYPAPHPIYACGYNGTWIRDVSFSSDGAHIATVADDGYLRFWDITSEESPEAMAPIENSLSCRFAPSGRLLAVTNKQGSVSFWNAQICIKPLQYISRISIRKIVSAENVFKLPIPKCLVDYLLFNDLK